jgi:TRAP-type mannitol/chloroaromatic compound transport system permease large subunit
MLQFVVANYAPLMFAALVLFMLLGFPVAFALAANGLLFGFLAVELGVFNFTLLQALPQRVFAILGNETLLAIPFFTFMGLILERSGMAEELLDTVGQLFGPIRGGIAYAVIFVGTLLAATTGVVAASVISMGLISLPIMLRYGYDRSLAAGTIVASGTLAQIVPPSLVLIVLADQLGRSVGAMYEAALFPGLILPLTFTLYVFFLSLIFPNRAPALPREVRQIEGGDTGAIVGFIVALFAVLFLIFGALFTGFAFLKEQFNLFAWKAAIGAFKIVHWHVLALAGLAMAVLLATSTRRRLNMGWKVIVSLVPPLLLIFLVLGTIFIGLATPTEGGAMGAAGALILAILNRRMNLSLLRQAMDSTAKLAAFVIFVLFGATCFSLTFNGAGGHHWVEGLLTDIPGGWIGFLLVVNAIVFVLGFFIDFFEIAFIVIPLLAPVAEKVLAPVLMGELGMSPGEAKTLSLIWFGVIIGVNMQTSFLTPPFGFSLFYLRSVAPEKPYPDKVTGKTIEPVSTNQIYRSIVPFVVLQVIVVVLIVAFPRLVFLNYEKPQTRDPSTIKIQTPGRTDDDDSGPGLPKIR